MELLGVFPTMIRMPNRGMIGMFHSWIVIDESDNAGKFVHSLAWFGCHNQPSVSSVLPSHHSSDVDPCLS